MYRSLLFVLTALCLVPAPALADHAADPLKISGDLRFRDDIDLREGDGIESDAERRWRPRLRARLGLAYATAVEGLSIGMRFASNVGSPGNSPHQTFSLTEVNVLTVDRAFFKYAPWKSVSFTAGKHGWPLWQQTEVFWDEDIQPEGFTLAGVVDLGGGGKIHLVVGDYFLDNNGWSEGFTENDELLVGQVRYGGDFGVLSPTLAFSFAKSNSSFTDAAIDPNAGMPSAGHTFEEPLFWSASVQVKLNDLPVGVKLGFDLHRSDAEADTMEAPHTAGMVGQLRLSKGVVGVRYYYYDVEEAAAPFFTNAALTQDNFPNSRGGGLAGFIGHRVQLDWKVAKNVGADLRVYMQEGKDDNELAFAETPRRKIQRYQLNLNFKF